MWNQARKQEIKERELERKGKEREKNWERTGKERDLDCLCRTGNKGNWKEREDKGKELEKN